MPRISDSIPINNEKLDKRIKLTSKDKEAIVEEYGSGLISISALAKKYNVSKRTIQFTLFPERRERNASLYKERRRDGRYYDKEKHREDIKKHREYKKELYKSGLISRD